MQEEGLEKDGEERKKEVNLLHCSGSRAVTAGAHVCSRMDGKVKAATCFLSWKNSHPLLIRSCSSPLEHAHACLGDQKPQSGMLNVLRKSQVKLSRGNISLLRAQVKQKQASGRKMDFTFYSLLSFKFTVIFF